MQYRSVIGVLVFTEYMLGFLIHGIVPLYPEIKFALLLSLIISPNAAYNLFQGFVIPFIKANGLDVYMVSFLSIVSHVSHPYRLSNLCVSVWLSVTILLTIHPYFFFQISKVYHYWSHIFKYCSHQQVRRFRLGRRRCAGICEKTHEWIRKRSSHQNTGCEECRKQQQRLSILNDWRRIEGGCHQPRKTRWKRVQYSVNNGGFLHRVQTSR